MSTECRAKKVVLNGRFSGTLQPTGTQTVAFQLFDAIVKASPPFELVIFADPAFPGIEAWRDFPRVDLRAVPFRQWKRSKAQLWEQFALPLEMRKMPDALVHHPIITSPRWPLGARTVVTVHDLTFYHHPEWIASNFRRWLMHTAVPGVRKATHVVAISDYVLADVRRTLGLNETRTSRIYNGLVTAHSNATDVARKPFTLLGVNLWQPHKNLPRLLEAFKLLRRRMPKAELILAGRPQAYYKSEDFAPELKAPGISVTGYLSASELAEAYATATVLCYPSLEEGFGLPILEAMASGTPVVTSNASCLPEIAGGAAILVDPSSPRDIARGLEEALSEPPAQREERSAAGRKVAARFRWETAAQHYIELYQRLLT